MRDFLIVLCIATIALISAYVVRRKLQETEGFADVPEMDIETLRKVFANQPELLEKVEKSLDPGNDDEPENAVKVNAGHLTRIDELSTEMINDIRNKILKRVNPLYLEDGPKARDSTSELTLQFQELHRHLNHLRGKLAEVVDRTSQKWSNVDKLEDYIDTEISEREPLKKYVTNTRQNLEQIGMIVKGLQDYTDLFGSQTHVSNMESKSRQIEKLLEKHFATKEIEGFKKDKAAMLEKVKKFDSFSNTLAQTAA